MGVAWKHSYLDHDARQRFEDADTISGQADNQDFWPENMDFSRCTPTQYRYASHMLDSLPTLPEMINQRTIQIL